MEKLQCNPEPCSTDSISNVSVAEYLSTEMHSHFHPASHGGVHTLLHGCAFHSATLQGSQLQQPAAAVPSHKLIASAAATSSTQECHHTRSDTSSSTVTAAAALLPLLPPLLCTQACRCCHCCRQRETLQHVLQQQNLH